MSSNAEVRRSLFDAISDNNLSLVEELVNHYGLSYCKAWSEGYSLLCNATEFGRDDISKFLLTKNAKVNSKNCTVNTPLHFAVRKGSPELVEMLINKHARVDVPNQTGETPLHIAIRRGSADIVRLLLNAGANCCALNKSCKEPLLIACSNGSVEAAKLLLHFRERKGFSSLQPLHLGLVLAAEYDSEELVSSLLKAGADPNAVIQADTIRNWKYTISMKGGSVPSPLLRACGQGNVAVVKLLLKHGAKLDCSREHDKYKPLHLASENGSVETVSHLLSINVDPNAEATNKETALHTAAKTRHIEVIKLLVNNGANVDALTDKGLTPLLIAVKCRQDENAKFLLERGAYINAKDNEHHSSLFHAIKAGNSHLISILLKYNPEIDVEIKKAVITKVIDHYHQQFIDDLIEYGLGLNQEDLKENPRLLPAAVEKGYTKIVELFLSHGFDSRDMVQNPYLLHVAVKHGHPAIIESLLRAGYDINVTDKTGKTPVCYSMFCRAKDKWNDIFQILLANGAIIGNASEFLHEAVEKECFEICKILIERCGAGVNTLSAKGETPLQIVASKKYSDSYYDTRDVETKIREAPDIAELLLSNGADVHFETKYGHSMIHVAAYKGKKEVTRLLLLHGANVNARAKNSHIDTMYFNVRDLGSLYRPVVNGPTALHFAAQTGNAEVVKVLLEFDADIDAQEGDGNLTALHGAIQRDSDEVVRVLLENGCDISIENNKGETALDLAVAKAKSSFTYERIDFDDEYYSSGEDDPNFIQVPINPDDHKVSNSLKMHAIKLEVAGLDVAEKILEQVNKRNPFLVEFQKECEKEINKMKEVKLCCHLTLYNILEDLKNPVYMKNETLRQTLCSLNFNNYPIYGSLVENGLEKSKRKVELLTTGEESLHIIMKTSCVLIQKESPVLLDEVSEEILSYLSNRDLKNLISAGESIKKQVCK